MTQGFSLYAKKLTYLLGEESPTQQEVHPTQKNLRYHPYQDREDEPRVAEGSCKRNGKVKNTAAADVASSWKIGDKMAKTSNASCEAVISALAVAHPKGLRQDLDAWIKAIQGPQPKPGPILLDDSLLMVLQWCQDSGNSSIKCEFFSMLSRVQLAVWCQRQVSSLLLLIYLIIMLL
jgi:hypothetical protein